MFTKSAEPPDTGEAAIRLPWFVKVSPEFYDDRSDTGYGWEGWAFNADDAVAQALEQCHLDNDHEPEQREGRTSILRGPRSTWPRSTFASSPGHWSIGLERWAAGKVSVVGRHRSSR